MTDQSDTGRAIVAIRRLVRALHLGSRATERSVGLSGARLFVLQRIQGTPGLSLGELAAQTMTDQSTVSVVVRRLVDRGLVKRERSTEDARRLVLSLTEAGAAALGGAPRTIQERMLESLQAMPEGEVHQLATLLEAFLQKAGLDREEPTLVFEDDEPPVKP